MARFAAAVAFLLLPTVLADGSLRSSNNVANLRHAAEDASESLAWSHKGCYTDKSTKRIFQTVTSSSTMTRTVCLNTCKNYPYFGVQNGRQCWCGNYTSSYTQHGASTKCTKKCAGNTATTCGGYDAMNVFTQAATDPSALGCYKDMSTDRALGNMWKNSGMTPSRCRDHCVKNEKYWYATQYGDECWCGDYGVDIDRHGAGTCNRPCGGDPTKFCGGSWAFSAYTTGLSGIPSNPSPTPVPVIAPYASSCTKASVRFAQSTGPAGRAYIEGKNNGECFTLTDLWLARGGKGPLYITDKDGKEDTTPFATAKPTGYWLLKGELYVTGGATLYVHGTAIGGDADMLRIQSNTPPLFHEVRAHGGSLSFKNTKVTSWDTDAGAVRVEYAYGRSFINCVSEKIEAGQTCEGMAKNDMGECRMDIINSEMGYLGYFDSESYGLTWKVRGFCVDLSNPEVFETTNVYGDIKNSDIHHMYYGMYSYGHQGGVWVNNDMHDNHQYGFDPHDDSDYLTISNNKVWGNANHGIIASKRCNNVVISNNTVWNGGAAAVGIMLHRSSDSAKVFDNEVHDMQDAGMSIFESFDNHVYNNTFKNVKYGLRISMGGGRNLIEDNVMDNCAVYGLYTYQGSDPPEASNGRPSENVFRNNVISSTEVGVKFKQADDTECYGNKFTGCKELQFEDSTDTKWYSNSINDGNGGACADIKDSTFVSQGGSGAPSSC